MLKQVTLENYRCFRNSRLLLKDVMVIVGSNNAGKSTVIEALRIISNVVQRYQYAVYQEVPSLLSYQKNKKGIKVDCSKLKIELGSIVHFYQEGIATITAIYENGNRVIVNLNSKGAYAFILDCKNNVIKSRSDAKEILLEKISIMPQLSLVREAEKKYTDEIIETNLETYLSSKHFRNELLMYKSEKMSKFRKLAESTWNGLKIKGLEYDPFQENPIINLYIEDNRFPAEIAMMGSGIQMWLQVIWFLIKSESSTIIILDEPDVYMHPDLQRKLVKMVRNLYRQVIIATHSIEIISEVDPNNIVSIDKKSKKMKYAGEYNAVQEMIDNLGSAQNLSLIRLGTMKKCIFVEGKDIKHLSKFYEIIHPNSTFSLESLPCIPLGGWTRFNEALGTARLFYEETQNSISTICILDRDYHTDDEIINLKEKALENHLQLIVWNKKEIESYFIIPEVIYRLVEKKYDNFQQFESELSDLIEVKKDEVIDRFSSQIHYSSNRSKAVPTCNSEARLIVNSKWNTLESKLSLINAKDLLSIINGWIQEKHKISCSLSKIVKLVKPEDISRDIVDTIETLVGNISEVD